MKPILFNTEMVRAILEGRKTVTRRIVSERTLDKYYDYDEWCNAVMPHDIPCTRSYEKDFFMEKPPYRPGDILYVRERVAQPFLPGSDEIHYYADYGDNNIVLRDGPYPEAIESKSVKWCSSASMPREAARIFLRVRDVWVERLQDITEEQARAEGISPLMISTDVEKPDNEKEWHEWGPALLRFQIRWDSTIKSSDRALYGWVANPWVWVITFERCEEPEEV